jgi:hypothetical protein
VRGVPGAAGGPAGDPDPDQGGGPGRPAAGRRGQWRHGRPFWGGLFVTGGAAVILVSERAPLPLIVHIGIQGVAGYLVPAVLLLCGLLLWFHPAQRTFYSVLAIVLALGSWITSNLGGFFIGLLLGVLGGALGVAWEQRASPPASPRPAPPPPPPLPSAGLSIILGPPDPDPGPGHALEPDRGQRAQPGPGRRSGPDTGHPEPDPGLPSGPPGGRAGGPPGYRPAAVAALPAALALLGGPQQPGPPEGSPAAGPG